MDVQQGSSEQPERIRMTLITDAVKKMSGKSGCMSSSEPNRKPFLALVRSVKIGIQPWPSATNLVHTGKRPSSEDSGSQMRRNSFNLPTIDVRRPSDDTTGQDEAMAFVNTAFSQEQIPQTSQSCDCDSHNLGDNVCSDVCQFQCRHENICEHLDDSVEIAAESFRPRLHSFPKHLLKRQRSANRKKKGVRWKPALHAEESKLRRRTIDSVPTAKKIVSQLSVGEKSCSKCEESSVSLDNDEGDVRL